jgi:hypothetical protein
MRAPEQRKAHFFRNYETQLMNDSRAAGTRQKINKNRLASRWLSAILGSDVFRLDAFTRGQRPPKLGPSRYLPRLGRTEDDFWDVVMTRSESLDATYCRLPR